MQLSGRFLPRRVGAGSIAAEQSRETDALWRGAIAWERLGAFLNSAQFSPDPLYGVRDPAFRCTSLVTQRGGGRTPTLSDDPARDRRSSKCLIDDVGVLRGGLSRSVRVSTGLALDVPGS
jgi:hypothetical protein